MMTRTQKLSLWLMGGLVVITLIFFVVVACQRDSWERRCRVAVSQRDSYSESFDRLRAQFRARPAVIKARETRLIAGELSVVETEVLERVEWRGKAYRCVPEEADSPE